MLRHTLVNMWIQDRHTEAKRIDTTLQKSTALCSTPSLHVLTTAHTLFSAKLLSKPLLLYTINLPQLCQNRFCCTPSTCEMGAEAIGRSRLFVKKFDKELHCVEGARQRRYVTGKPSMARQINGTRMPPLVLRSIKGCRATTHERWSSFAERSRGCVCNLLRVWQEAVVFSRRPSSTRQRSSPGSEIAGLPVRSSVPHILLLPRRSPPARVWATLREPSARCMYPPPY